MPLFPWTLAPWNAKAQNLDNDTHSDAFNYVNIAITGYQRAKMIYLERSRIFLPSLSQHQKQLCSICFLRNADIKSYFMARKLIPNAICGIGWCTPQRSCNVLYSDAICRAQKTKTNISDPQSTNNPYVDSCFFRAANSNCLEIPENKSNQITQERRLKWRNPFFCTAFLFAMYLVYAKTPTLKLKFNEEQNIKIADQEYSRGRRFTEDGYWVYGKKAWVCRPDSF